MLAFITLFATLPYPFTPAQLSLISALIAACAEGDSSQAHTNLETLEKIWDQYHVYSSDGEDA